MRICNAALVAWLLSVDKTISTTSAFMPLNIVNTHFSSSRSKSLSFPKLQPNDLEGLPEDVSGGFGDEDPQDAAMKLAYREWKLDFGKDPDAWEESRFRVFKRNFLMLQRTYDTQVLRAKMDGRAPPPQELELNEYADCTREEYLELQNPSPDVVTQEVQKLESTPPKREFDDDQEVSNVFLNPDSPRLPNGSSKSQAGKRPTKPKPKQTTRTPPQMPSNEDRFSPFLPGKEAVPPPPPSISKSIQAQIEEAMDETMDEDKGSSESSTFKSNEEKFSPLEPIASPTASRASAPRKEAPMKTLEEMARQRGSEEAKRKAKAEQQRREEEAATKAALERRMEIARMRGSAVQSLLGQEEEEYDETPKASPVAPATSSSELDQTSLSIEDIAQQRGQQEAKKKALAEAQRLQEEAEEKAAYEKRMEIARQRAQATSTAVRNEKESPLAPDDLLPGEPLNESLVYFSTSKKTKATTPTFMSNEDKFSPSLPVASPMSPFQLKQAKSTNTDKSIESIAKQRGQEEAQKKANAEAKRLEEEAEENAAYEKRMELARQRGLKSSQNDPLEDLEYKTRNDAVEGIKAENVIEPVDAEAAIIENAKLRGQQVAEKRAEEQARLAELEALQAEIEEKRLEDARKRAEESARKRVEMEARKIEAEEEAKRQTISAAQRRGEILAAQKLELEARLAEEIAAEERAYQKTLEQAKRRGESQQQPTDSNSEVPDSIDGDSAVTKNDQDVLASAVLRGEMAAARREAEQAKQEQIKMQLEELKQKNLEAAKKRGEAVSKVQENEKAKQLSFEEELKESALSEAQKRGEMQAKRIKEAESRSAEQQMEEENSKERVLENARLRGQLNAAKRAEEEARRLEQQALEEEMEKARLEEAKARGLEASRKRDEARAKERSFEEEMQQASISEAQKRGEMLAKQKAAAESRRLAAEAAEAAAQEKILELARQRGLELSGKTEAGDSLTIDAGGGSFVTENDGQSESAKILGRLNAMKKAKEEAERAELEAAQSAMKMENIELARRRGRAAALKREESKSQKQVLEEEAEQISVSEAQKRGEMLAKRREEAEAKRLADQAAEKEVDEKIMDLARQRGLNREQKDSKSSIKDETSIGEGTSGVTLFDPDVVGKAKARGKILAAKRQQAAFNRKVLEAVESEVDNIKMEEAIKRGEITSQERAEKMALRASEKELFDPVSVSEAEKRGEVAAKKRAEAEAQREQELNAEKEARRRVMELARKRGKAQLMPQETQDTTPTGISPPKTTTAFPPVSKVSTFLRGADMVESANLPDGLKEEDRVDALRRQEEQRRSSTGTDSFQDSKIGQKQQSMAETRGAMRAQWRAEAYAEIIKKEPKLPAKKRSTEIKGNSVTGDVTSDEATPLISTWDAAVLRGKDAAKKKSEAEEAKRNEPLYDAGALERGWAALSRREMKSLESQQMEDKKFQNDTEKTNSKEQDGGSLDGAANVISTWDAAVIRGNEAAQKRAELEESKRNRPLYDAGAIERGRASAQKKEANKGSSGSVTESSSSSGESSATKTPLVNAWDAAVTRGKDAARKRVELEEAKRNQPLYDAAALERGRAEAMRQQYPSSKSNANPQDVHDVKSNTKEDAIFGKREISNQSGENSSTDATESSDENAKPRYRVVAPTSSISGGKTTETLVVGEVKEGKVIPEIADSLKEDKKDLQEGDESISEPNGIEIEPNGLGHREINGINGSK